MTDLDRAFFFQSFREPFWRLYNLKNRETAGLFLKYIYLKTAGFLLYFANISVR